MKIDKNKVYKLKCVLKKERVMELETIILNILLLLLYNSIIICNNILIYKIIHFLKIIRTK